MVNISNIFIAFNDLTNEEEIVLECGADLQISIFAEDKLEKMNNDLKIIRKKNNAIIVVEANAIKFFIVRRRFI